MMDAIVKRVGGALAAIVAVLATAAMLVGALPAQAVEAQIGSDAGAKANVYQALQYIQQLNELRARTDRRPLTAQQIADAKNADKNTTMYNASNVNSLGADGTPVAPVKVNWDMMKWAQTRANELVEKGGIDHSNMYNGAPSWYVHVEGRDYNLIHSDHYQYGVYFDGPEALAYAWTSTGDMSGNAIDSWYSELNYEKENPNASASDLAQWRQGYGHYLTEISPLADIAGIGVAVKNGITITVLEIGNNYLDQGKTQTVEDALKDYAPKKTIQSVTSPKKTVESGTVKPTDLPKTVAVTYSDGTAGTVAVTWDEIPNDWNKDRDEHVVTVHGSIEGYAAGVDLKLTVKAAKATTAAFADGADETSVTTESGTAPILPKTAKVTWSNGDTTDETIAWSSSDGYTKPEGGKYDLKGTVEGFTLTAHVTVNAATVTGVDQPAAATVSKGTKPTVPSTAKVHWSNGGTTDEKIVWDADADPTTATFDTVGEFTFSGTAAGQQVTWKVTVAETQVTKAYDPDPITVESGTDPTPKLPATVKADLDNGQTGQQAPVVWDAVPDTWKDRKGGAFELKGTVNGQADKTVTIKVTVKPATIADVTLPAISTAAGVDPTGQLPKTVSIAWSNGETQDGVEVKWDAIKADSYAKEGTFDATGTVSVDGVAGKVTQPVTVTAAAAVKAEPTVGSVETIATNTPDLSVVKANVTYSDGSVKQADVDWPADIDVSQPGDVKVTGTVRGVTDKDGKALAVTITVKVAARAITAVAPSGDAIAVESGTTAPANLTGKATVTWNDGKTETRSIALTLPDGWNKGIAEHTVSATGRTDGWDKDITFTVTVKAAVAQQAADPDAVTTTVGKAPTLPKQAVVTYSNGETASKDVTWERVSDDDFATAGKTVTVNGTVEGLAVAVKVNVVKATITGVDNPDGVSIDAGGELNLPSTVTAHWSGGTADSQVAVTWKTDGVDFSNRTGQDKTVTVTGAVDGWNEPVTVAVTVHSATVTGATLDGAPVSVTVESGEDPVAKGKLPKSANVTWSDGGEASVEDVTWDAAFDKYKVREGGTFTIEGTVRGQPVSATVVVNAAKPVKLQQERIDVSTTVGVKPELPAKATVVWSNGDVTDELVTWDSTYDASLLDKPTKFAVQGKVAVPENASANAEKVVTYDITATVTVKVKGSSDGQQTGQNQNKPNAAQQAANKLVNTGADVLPYVIAVIVIAVIAAVVLVVVRRKRK